MIESTGYEAKNYVRPRSPSAVRPKTCDSVGVFCMFVKVSPEGSKSPTSKANSTVSHSDFDDAEIMREAITALLIPLFLAGCANTSAVDEDTASRIPDGASVVRIQYEDTRAEAEEKLLQEFARRGIAVEDEEANTWTTRPKNLGNAGQENLLSLRISFLEPEGDNTTKVLVRGTWGVEGNDAVNKKAEWTWGRKKTAFGAATDIAMSTFPDSEVEFGTE